MSAASAWPPRHNLQTFLPYPSYERSARALDQRRLGKQRSETLQILRALLGINRGWQNHPATRMWRGHEEALLDYGIAICREWRRRGYADTVLEKLEELRPSCGGRSSKPSWIGQRRFHRSHQSALVRKDPAFYGPRFPSADPDLEIVWPVGPLP